MTHIHVPDHIPPEDVDGYIARIVKEAEAEQADERAKLKTIGQAVTGFAGVGVAAYAALWDHEPVIALGGILTAFVGFGLITVEQVLSYWRKD
jgi:hypothetical protein